jgi:hypothetical protein
MKRKAYQMVFPVALVVGMVTFLSAIFMADATLSYASSGKKSVVATKTAVDYTESRIKQLSRAIKITAGQELLWSSVTQVMRENAKEMDALSKVRAEKAETMNSVEQIKFHSKVTEAQLAQQRKFIPPFEAFYASMSEGQKKITDNIFRTGKYGKERIK